MAQESAAPDYVSYEDYLAAEVEGGDKHEWLDGVVYAMSRGTPEHARLTANVTSALRAAFRGDCTVYSSDAMLFVRESGLSTYADASVTCGTVQTHRVVKNGRSIGEAITNPVIVVEVLSDRTQDYDRGEKFGHYMRMPSLKAYVLVAQSERRIDVFRRPDHGGHWRQEVAAAGQTVELLGRPLALDDVYDS